MPHGEVGLCTHEFTNLILFRNPLDRLSSHISWIQKLYTELYPEDDISEVFG